MRARRSACRRFESAAQAQWTTTTRVIMQPFRMHRKCTPPAVLSAAPVVIVSRLARIKVLSRVLSSLLNAAINCPRNCVIMSASSLPFHHPSTILVAGPTGCGKTQFLVKLFTTTGAIQPTPQRIVWVYSEWQSAYDKLRAALAHHIEFLKDYDSEALYNSFNSSVRNVLVLDDQMDSDGMRSGGGATTLIKFFTQGSHHRNLTIIYIVQNMFNRDRTMRTVNLNSHYLILYKNPRDKTQVRTLAQQMYPNNSRFLVDAFEDATSAPYSYLLLDLRPETPEQLRVRAKVFEEEGKSAVVYVPSEPPIKTWCNDRRRKK